MNLINFLTEPNEIVTFIISTLLGILESYLFYIFFIKVLNMKINKKQKYIYLIIFNVSAFIVNYFLPNIFANLINVLIFILLIKFVFKQNLRTTFLAVILPYLLLFLLTFLNAIISKILFTMDIDYLIHIPLYRAISVCLVCLFFYIDIYIINYIRQIFYKFYTKIRISLNLTVILNLILGIIAIAIQSYILSKYKDKIPFSLMFFNIFTLIIYFFISMYSLFRTNVLEKTTEELEKEKIYNKALTLLHDNIRCFKHDFNNIVQSIGGYIHSNDMDGLRNYHQHLLGDCIQTNNLNALNPESINNPAIYSLLTNKYFIATEKGIKISFTMFADLQKINFNIYEFTRILGILVDNAIEAAQDAENKIINIEFLTKKKSQLFIIENTCKDLNISTTKIFEKGYSTKPKEHNSGIGLWKVHNILSKNTDADLFTTIKDGMFRQELEIFYK